MKKRISNPDDITPAYEDQGLFKKPSTELVINLIPKFGKNTRHDVIIKGLMENGVEVDVIFAGRRKHQAAELVTLMKRKWEEANYSVVKGSPPPKRKSVRVPTRVQGSWRTRVIDDEQNLYCVEHQLLVARWAYHGSGGEFCSFGEPPYVQQRFKEFLEKSRE
ncbi:hypothetical protein [Shimia sp. MMG029]|uniref:hypothetical protein n=1 Tax=Shimia sp. MMG029 TaxID=3021978 RepID=UPI0022FE82EE|nr:hypothetical protein [Shimia sp. MMG029]MDA5557281.1 hypothetical protein [Shimia sp. MMG029]